MEQVAIEIKQREGGFIWVLKNAGTHFVRQLPYKTEKGAKVAAARAVERYNLFTD